MGFSKPLRSLVFAFSALLVVGTVVSPAQAAATATPLFLSFETDDSLGAEVAKPAAPGHALGSWYPDAVTAIAPTPAPTIRARHCHLLSRMRPLRGVGLQLLMADLPPLTQTLPIQ